MSALRRGAVLIEMVIALALFVAGAAMLTQLQTSVTRSLDRARLSVEATDLARKALAELETGIITLADVRTMQVRTEQALDRMQRRDQMDDIADPSPWQFTVNTERSPYPGLTLVELTVAYVGEEFAQLPARESVPGKRANRNDVRITIRQLMRLRDDSMEDEDSLPAESEGGL